MFPLRAVVVSIVLTLAVAPNAALLCRAWCDPQVAAASACHHEKSPATSSVVADPTRDECDQSAVRPAQFLREDVRRSVSALDAGDAILVARYQFAPSTTDTRSGQEPWREWRLEKQPLLTALRL